MTRPDTTRLVMKFGGTSMGDLERIRRAARIVAAEVKQGRKVAVVVSAMAGKTNELVAWTDGAGAAEIAALEAERVLKLYRRIWEECSVALEYLDLGGGYGIAYTESEAPLDVRAVAADLLREVQEVADDLGIDPLRGPVPAVGQFQKLGQPAAPDDGFAQR